LRWEGFHLFDVTVTNIAGENIAGEKVEGEYRIIFDQHVNANQRADCSGRQQIVH
jgi:hypothetical protein